MIRQAVRNYSEQLRDNSVERIARARLYLNRGDARAQLLDYDGAMRDFAKALELRPDYAKGFNNRGFVRRQLGDVEGALVDFDRAIELDPKLAIAYHNRGALREKLGDTSVALTDYATALKHDPKQANIYFQRGMLLARSGEHALGLADLTTAAMLERRIRAFFEDKRCGFSWSSTEERVVLSEPQKLDACELPKH